MNKRDLTYISLMISVVLVLAGCETVPKKFREEVSGIKTRVETLESKVEGVEAKQADVERMTSEQAQALEELRIAKERHVKTNIGTKPRFAKKRGRTKEIQACLKNAGFYDGEIDGIKGKKTRRAIKEFQKANGLIPDGIVGKKTWEFLSKYPLGAAQTSFGAEEGITK